MNRRTVAGEASVALLCSTFRLSRAAYYAGDRTAVVVVTKDQHGPAVLASVELKLVESFGAPENVPSDVELRTDHGPQYTGSVSDARTP